MIAKVLFCDEPEVGPYHPFYYVGIKIGNIDLIVAGWHPAFPNQFSNEFINAEAEAQKLANKLNQYFKELK